MKPSGQNKRSKDWLPFVNFAMIRGNTLKELNLREHLLPYRGCEDDEGYVWGVYGTTSINAATFTAGVHARSLSHSEGAVVFSLQLNAWLRIDNFCSVPSRLRANDVEEHGYMHLGRLASSYREVVRRNWRDWVVDHHPTEADTLAAVLDDMTVTDLAVRFPGYVRVMLRQDKRLHAVVHPVIQNYENSKVPIWVLTARNDHRIMACEARFATDVVVTI